MEPPNPQQQPATASRKRKASSPAFDPTLDPALAATSSEHESSSLNSPAAPPTTTAASTSLEIDPFLATAGPDSRYSTSGVFPDDSDLVSPTNTSVQPGALSITDNQPDSTSTAQTTPRKGKRRLDSATSNERTSISSQTAKRRRRNTKAKADTPEASADTDETSTAVSSISAMGSADRPRLTEEEKKRNHIESEQKRRMAIREGFDRLTEIVPGLEGQGRSESIVLRKSVDHMRDVLKERQELIERIEALGGEVPPEFRN